MPNIVIGLLALAFGLWGLSIWWWSVTELLRGLFPLLLLGVGFVALAAGITKIQKPDSLAENEEKDELEDDLLTSPVKSQSESKTNSDERVTKAKPVTTKKTSSNQVRNKVVTAKSTATKKENKPAENISPKNTDKK